MLRMLATLSLIASLGLASCTNSAAAPHDSARDDQDRSAPPSLAIRATAITAEAPAAVADVHVASKLNSANVANEDDLYRQQVVGIWKQYESGVRWLKVRDDGTATMFVDPAGSWAAKAIIGDGLTIHIEWSIDDGWASMKSVSGEPASTFKAVSALFGTDRNREITKLDEETFVMLDDSDGSKSEWTRVRESESLPTAIVE